ncbi:lysophospholipid acyltransferase 7 isoform X2 [Prorops nasuta]|uniref:lysophospholipid acyltransferase 7 isoform X2 n=1 Tax=Prorops nasuta TaxID=863751 RepID=UPI0034CFEB24
MNSSFSRIKSLIIRICHLVSFYFSCFHLLVICRLGWFGIPIPPGHTNLIMMILTLKVPGMAFEVNSARQATEDDPQGLKNESLQNIGVLDVFHYAFSYMGVLTGPYYRYRTYWDSIHRNFAKHVDPWPAVSRKLIAVAVYIVLFIVFSKSFPAEYVLTEEFAERSLLYRIWYIYPAFVTFRTRLYTGMALAECACQMAGLGAYPTSCDPTPGGGPRNYRLAENLHDNDEKLKLEEIDFETVHNMKVWELEKSYSTRVAMKVWNCCAQYSIAMMVYKRFPIKSLRTLATFLFSSVWHGYAAGYYFGITSVAFYLPFEDIYIKIYKQLPEDGLAKKSMTVFMWFMRTSCMAYLSFAFQLLEFYKTVHYYYSVYFAGHILVAILYGIGKFASPHILVDKKRKEL